MKSPSRRSMFVLVAVGLFAAGLAACGGQGSSVAAASRIAPSDDFADVFSADLAGDAGGLTLAVAGQLRTARRETIAVRIYQRDKASRWLRTPRLTEPLDSGATVSLVRLHGVPCVGYQTSSAKRTLACLTKSGWKGLSQVGLPPRAARLMSLTLLDGRPIAIFFSEHAAGGQLLALRLEGDRWRHLGEPIPTNGGIAALGDTSSVPGTLDVGLADVKGPRTVWSFSGGKWRRQARLEGIDAGPMPSGPVRLGSRVYLPVIDASKTPWQFSVYVSDGGSWSRVGQPLNRGPGNAQGVLRVNDGSVWAAWQQNELREKGGFSTQIYAQRIAPVGAQPTLVWSGISLGPGSLETVWGAGHQWMLYMPQSRERGHGLTVRIRPLT